MKKPELDPMVSLFNALASRLAESIGDEMSPAMAEVARKFLADNGINCDLSQAAADTAAGELAGKALPFKLVDDEDTEAFG